MEDSTRAEKLRLYLINIIEELNSNFSKNKQINFNFLSNTADNYSIDKIPTQTITEKWIIGPTLSKDIYSFRSRMNYSADVIQNIKNVGFYELFEKKIKQKNESGELPDIDGIQSISCLNSGTMNNADTNTAEFDIQIMIEYID